MPDWLSFKMNSKRYARWSKIRKRGVAFYVLFWGVLFFGNMACAATLCLEDLWDHKALEIGYVSRLVISWLVIGLFWGFATWAISEYQFEKFEAKQNFHPSKEQVS